MHYALYCIRWCLMTERKVNYPSYTLHSNTIPFLLNSSATQRDKNSICLLTERILWWKKSHRISHAILAECLSTNTVCVCFVSISQAEHLTWLKRVICLFVYSGSRSISLANFVYVFFLEIETHFTEEQSYCRFFLACATEIERGSKKKNEINTPHVFVKCFI